ncbi:restriction endonuclease subunit S [Amycolatopsis magusensis]|uniref:restriction endonuclease subunit S n=1 Tax=Amycolatopsis magusensis TaxID=882444 RepID=UPI0037AB8AD8
MSDLPEGWEWTTLGEIAESVRNGIFVSRPGKEPDGVPILRISSVRPLKLNTNDIRYSGILEPDLKAKDSLLTPGDILFTRYSGTADFVGVGALVPQGIEPLTYPDKLIRVRLPKNYIDARYVALAFASPAVRENVTKVLRTTAGQIGISGDALKSVRLPMAPLAEQRRIVATLDNHLSRIDTAASTLQQSTDRTRALPSQIFESVLCSMPYDQVTLNEILAEPLINGRSVPSLDGGFPVLRLTAIKGGRIDLQERKTGAWTINEAKPFLVNQGDFLVSRGNGSLKLVGRGGLIVDEPDGVAFPDTLIRIRPDKHRVSPQYFALEWNSSKVRAQIESVARTTAGIYKVNQSLLRKIQIRLPNISDQLRIVAEVNGAATLIDSASASARQAMTRHTRLRQSLLTAAFAGQLVPQDHGDEPASELLRRIAVEHSFAQKSNRARRTTTKTSRTSSVQETLL